MSAAAAVKTGPISEQEWREHRNHALDAGLPPAGNDNLPDVLISYQQKLLATTALHQFVVVEKSRRIGVTWAVGADAVLTAGAARSAGGMDALYIGYNLDMAREFIDVCAMWARAFMPAATAVEEFLFRDEDEHGNTREIQAFRIGFASGFEIVALTSKPRSLRGRQGYVILDEAAFHDDLDGVLKAAVALLMWGGKVLVMSTHDGEDNAFNQLIEEIRGGRRKGKVMRITFADALAQGLYERICLVKRQDCTDAGKAEWESDIRAFYGDDADEELDVVPSKGSGVWLTRTMIDACMSPECRVAYLACPAGFEQMPGREREAFVEAWLEDNVDPILDRFDPKLQSFLGGDFGRTMDLSVLLPGQAADRNMTLRVPVAIELRNVPFRQQEQILSHVISRLPRFMAGALDARGLGMSLSEGAQQDFGFERIEGVNATSDWYRDNMPGLKKRFENTTIEIPRDNDIRQDLRLVKKDKGVPRVPENKRVKSERGGMRHGDFAIAAAMLHYATTMDSFAYGYEAAPPAPRRYDDGPGEDESPLARRRRENEGAECVGRIRGAW